MRITVFDYGAGNLHSLLKAIARSGVIPTVEADPTKLVGTDLLILPGVGAFGPAAARLAPARVALRRALLDGLPCLGICLGMQLLFDGSDEGAGESLGVIEGRVTRLAAARTPAIGWNELEEVADPLPGAAGLTSAYYAHSFVGRPKRTEVTTAWSRHEADRFPAMVRVARTLGVQFHPEKSSDAGVRLVSAFIQSVSQ